MPPRYRAYSIDQSPCTVLRQSFIVLSEMMVPPLWNHISAVYAEAYRQMHVKHHSELESNDSLVKAQARQALPEVVLKHFCSTVREMAASEVSGGGQAPRLSRLLIENLQRDPVAARRFEQAMIHWVFYYTKSMAESKHHVDFLKGLQKRTLATVKPEIFCSALGKMALSLVDLNPLAFDGFSPLRERVEHVHEAKEMLQEAVERALMVFVPIDDVFALDHHVALEPLVLSSQQQQAASARGASVENERKQAADDRARLEQTVASEREKHRRDMDDAASRQRAEMDKMQQALIAFRRQLEVQVKQLEDQRREAETARMRLETANAESHSLRGKVAACEAELQRQAALHQQHQFLFNAAAAAASSAGAPAVPPVAAAAASFSHQPMQSLYPSFLGAQAEVPAPPPPPPAPLASTVQPVVIRAPEEPPAKSQAAQDLGEPVSSVAARKSAATPAAPPAEAAKSTPDTSRFISSLGDRAQPSGHGDVPSDDEDGDARAGRDLAEEEDDEEQDDDEDVDAAEDEQAAADDEARAQSTVPLLQKRG